MDINEATGTETIEIKLGDKTYKLSPLTLKEYGAIESDMKQAKRRELTDATEDLGMTGAERAKFIIDELAKVNIFNSISTMDGIAFVTYHSIKKCHPDVKFDEIVGKIDIDNLNIISESLGKLMSVQTKNGKGQAVKPE
jgi:hypothetical protein